MKSKTAKSASGKLRHQPVGSKNGRKFDKMDTRNKTAKNQPAEDDEEEYVEDDNNIPSKIKSSLLNDAQEEVSQEDDEVDANSIRESEDGEEELDDVEEDYVYDADGKLLQNDFDADYRLAVNESEEEVIKRFLYADKMESRSLADLILEKLKEKEAANENIASLPNQDQDEGVEINIPPKVVEVYSAVGNMLSHYRSGKLPKALKMLPHLKNWEQILWITRPDRWTAMATYVVTRIFVSNLKVKMAQRFFNIVLLEKCRDDINRNDKLNYHLYMALKKALFKPAAFYKGILLPLALSGTCTLREATIIGSVITKVSIPSIHSAAALLRLAEMPYTGSNSVFIKLLLVKKYALPQRVIDALVQHFQNFLNETRALPVIWHQSLLIFVQRYKLDFTPEHVASINNLIKRQSHHEITPEIKRELVMNRNAAAMQL